MFSCFAVKELEWELLGDSHRQRVDIRDCGKKLQKKSGDYAFMRLNNENNINLKYEANLRVKSELQNNAWMLIGLVNSERWDERINYHHCNEQIYDNDQGIKRVNKKVNKNSIIRIKNKIIKKANDNEKVFKVSFTINDEDSGVMYYQDVQPMVPYLWFYHVVEVDVEVISKILIIFLRS